ncbi:MAG: AzlC family ABC transporter permease [Firmicutes bacterium]|nr:AzlC family ABC transporter permease [Bacillota bacterium]
MGPSSFGQGLRDGLPIGLGYFPVSFAFGILASSGGLSWWQASLISLLNLTSAGQFAGLDILLSSGTLMEMAISQVVINIRYSLMSITLSQKVDASVGGYFRYVFPFNVTDEIFGIAATRPSISRSYWRGIRVLPIVGWTLGTLMGALLGSVLPEALMNAMSVMLYAMFIAIIIPICKKEMPVLIACLIAVCLNTLLTYVPFLKNLGLSSAMGVIVCAVLSSLICAVLFPRPMEGGTDES